jgi:Flp pilus assembly protein TadD
MNGTDLRGAYLTNANLTATNLDSAYVQGSMGMPTNAGTPELFFGWGLLESRKGNFKAALSNYNKALSIDPHFAPGYLGRGLALLRLGDEAAAKQNVEYASQLFEEEKNTDGYDTAQNFLKNLQAMQEAREKGAGTPQLDAIVRGVASLALQFLLR